VTEHTAPNTRIMEIHHSLKLQSLPKQTVLQWIPSHYRTEGDEQADFLEIKKKKGTLI